MEKFSQTKACRMYVPMAAVVASFCFYGVYRKLSHHHKKVLCKTPTPFKLIEKEVLTQGVAHPVVRFRFSTGNAKKSLGLMVGDHIKVYDAKQEYHKPYTPITPVDTLGYFDIVVKVYHEQNGKPPGRISNYLNQVKIGEKVYMSGPVKGHHYEPNSRRHWTFIAGGSGLTPCLQAIETICRNKKDHTTVKLIYCNSTEEDIILKDRLDKLAEEHPNKFFLKYVVSKPSKLWTGYRGRICDKIIEKEIPVPDTNHRIGICGPKEFVRTTKQILKAKNYFLRTHYFVY